MVATKMSISNCDIPGSLCGTADRAAPSGRRLECVSSYPSQGSTATIQPILMELILSLAYVLGLGT